MRDIKYIVLHCTATPQDTTVDSILHFWKTVRKWNIPGYHFLIEPSGKVHNLVPIEEIANGVKGYNKECIHISYIGGVTDKYITRDNRTAEQIAAQVNLIVQMKRKFPQAEIKGHYQFPNVHKLCPSFNVPEWITAVFKNSL